ncbi:MAG: hypothetical protein K1X61_02160 [Chitinophagales bacterium]|nr:hypothetical protein [Chitinophagales bacterium]
MKKIIILLVLFLTGGAIQQSSAQNTFPSSGAAGIGTTTPNGSSLLDISSTSKGVLLPRMTKTQRDGIAAPTEGLLIYQTNSQPGFYYYDGSSWKSVLQLKKDLSNLNATAINLSLVPNASGAIDLGSDVYKWRDAYVTNIKFADGTIQSTAGGGGGAETDPQVGTNTTNYVPKWNGSALVTGVLQDNGTNLWTGSPAFAGTRGKLDLHNTTTSKGLNIETAYSTSGQAEGIHSFVTTASTGTKYGFYNQVWQTTGTSGVVNGIYNDIQNYGTGVGYGNRTVMDLLGSGTNYGNYTSMTSGASGTLYGDYKTIQGLGSLYGQYISIPSASGSNTKTGVYVNIPSTTGTNYGLFSVVDENNSGSYSAFLYGKVYCTGNVGIGVTNPQAQLHVDYGEDAEPTGGGYIISGSMASSNIAIDNNEIMARNNGAVSKLYLNNDGGDISMCYAGGNVMIGASVPATGYLLSVDGKVICEELKVQLSESWPDYVFDEGYSMPSISELKKFVSTNKHLPGIPPADEMKEQGLSVGEMQTKMMQKVEELSLYIIQLQDQIDALKQQQ